MNRNAKISVGVLLSLGVLASLSACIRLRYTVRLNNSDDFLFAIGDVVIWGYAENAIGLIVGCISTLRPLFRSMLHLDETGRDRAGHRIVELAPPRSSLSKYTDGRHREGGKSGITKSVQLRAESGDLVSESEEELVRDMRRGNRW